MIDGERENGVNYEVKHYTVSKTFLLSIIAHFVLFTKQK